MFCLLRVLRDALKQYNITSQYFTGKENEMLQEITIQTTDLEQFKSVLQIALERESKLLEYSIQRTHEALAPFEQRNRRNPRFSGLVDGSGSPAPPRSQA
jgi:hypothetical protein